MTRNTFDDDYTSSTTGHLDSCGLLGLLVSRCLCGGNVVSMLIAYCNFILIHNTIFNQKKKECFRCNHIITTGLSKCNIEQAIDWKGEICYSCTLPASVSPSITKLSALSASREVDSLPPQCHVLKSHFLLLPPSSAFSPCAQTMGSPGWTAIRGKGWVWRVPCAVVLQPRGCWLALQ